MYGKYIFFPNQHSQLTNDLYMEGKLSLWFCFKLKAALPQLITAWLMKHTLKGQQEFWEAHPVICSHNKFSLNLRTARVCHPAPGLSCSEHSPQTRWPKRSQKILYKGFDFPITSWNRKLNNLHQPLALNTKLQLLSFPVLLLITEFNYKLD